VNQQSAVSFRVTRNWSSLEVTEPHR